MTVVNVFHSYKVLYYDMVTNRHVIFVQSMSDPFTATQHYLYKQISYVQHTYNTIQVPRGAYRMFNKCYY